MTFVKKEGEGKTIRIYVAGPYSGLTDETMLVNVQRAMDAGLVLIERGHQPFVPHLNHWWDLRAEELRGKRISWDIWMEVVSAYIPVCEGFLYLAPSKGADIELLIAKACGRRIFYTTEEVPYDRNYAHP